VAKKFAFKHKPYIILLVEKVAKTVELDYQQVVELVDRVLRREFYMMSGEVSNTPIQADYFNLLAEESPEISHFAQSHQDEFNKFREQPIETDGETRSRFDQNLINYFMSLCALNGGDVQIKNVTKENMISWYRDLMMRYHRAKMKKTISRTATLSFVGFKRSRPSLRELGFRRD
jgi:hypothetical protein